MTTPVGDFYHIEEESPSDYTVINRGSPSPCELEIGIDSPRSDIVTRNSPRPGNFKCSQCFKVIEVGKPIYMRNDFPYCSKDCRELGVSSIYRVLFGSSVDNDAGFVSRILKQIGGSSTSVSSVDSGDEEDEFDVDDQRTTSQTVSMNARARARSFLKSVVSSVSQTSLGSSFIRTYSNSLLWGKDMTRNTSFNMLFAYLPELDENRGNASVSRIPSRHLSLSSDENLQSVKVSSGTSTTSSSEPVSPTSSSKQ